ncbi:MAG TPA: hypothetical protein PLZ53_02560 [Candidatus Hydrogenedentes bacterium]|nr:hypothetical protein [Candidatus Hydrogenedentota bacterium]
MTVNAFQMDSFTLSRAGSEVEAAATLSFVLADGEHKVLSFGAEKDGNYEASLSWLPCLFTAKSLEYLRLFADIDALLPQKKLPGLQRLPLQQKRPEQAVWLRKMPQG